MNSNKENTYSIVQKTRLYNVVKEFSSLNVSKASVEKMQSALNLVGMALIEASVASAIYNQRKTIMPQDVDVALENFYCFLNVFNEFFGDGDEFFKDDEHFEENLLL